MKMILLMTAVALTFSLNAIATDQNMALTETQKARVIADLTTVDQFTCNIEMKSMDRVRMLTTSFNPNVNRYFDLHLAADGLKYTETATGWKLDREIDLSKGLNRPYPKWMYGARVTAIEFTKVSGGATVSVYAVESDLGLGIRLGKTSFECSSSEGVHVDKRAICPECLSSAK